MTAIVPRALARVARPMLAACVMVCAPATALAQGSSWSWLSWDVGESFFPGVPQPQFLEQQLSFSRVRDARDEKRQQLITEFAERGLTYPAAGIYLRAFKRERVVEVWVRPLGRVHYTLFKAYPMCVLSGTLGPKRRQGDMQVPEGFYSLTYFNPTSEYYLSLGISYPNRADRVRENDDALGGDIFVHGGCRTIGCVPVTDDQMKEIYWLAVEARAAGQPEIPIHIFPTRLDEAGLDLLAAQFPGRRDLHEFWQNLHEGYHSFEQTLQVPLVAINRSGRYIFGEQAWLARLDAAETSAPLLGAPVDRQPPPPAPPGVTVWSGGAPANGRPAASVRPAPLAQGLVPAPPRATRAALAPAEARLLGASVDLPASGLVEMPPAQIDSAAAAAATSPAGTPTQQQTRPARALAPRSEKPANLLGAPVAPVQPPADTSAVTSKPRRSR